MVNFFFIRAHVRLCVILSFPLLTLITYETKTGVKFHFVSNEHKWGGYYGITVLLGNIIFIAGKLLRYCTSILCKYLQVVPYYGPASCPANVLDKWMILGKARLPDELSGEVPEKDYSCPANVDQSFI